MVLGRGRSAGRGVGGDGPLWSFEVIFREGIR